MRESRKTGSQIFAEITMKRNQLTDLNDALGTVETGTLAHDILQKAYDDEENELIALEKSVYAVVQQG